MIQAQAVSYRVGGKQIVQSISLELRCGEVLAVVGPNGAGKSTLLKLLSGELRPSSGQVTVNGQALSGLRAKALARLRAVLAQDNAAVSGLSARNLVLLGRTPHIQFSETEADWAATDRAMAEADVGRFARRQVQTLSGGERQRVHFARTINQINGPTKAERYLFLDEPTAALDLSHQLQILTQAGRLAAADCGVLVILHDLNLAAAFADRLAMIDRGSLVVAGSPWEVLTAATVQQVFQTKVIVQKHPVLDCPHLVVIP